MTEFNKALLIHVDMEDKTHFHDQNEFSYLVESAGIKTIKLLKISRKKVDVRFFIGSGKLEYIKTIISDYDLIIFNNALSPSQGRNLQQYLCTRVIDRTELILDIFAQRALSFEGKLQVELAQLQHLSTRLIRRWTHLERQKGGIGLRGPGESQLELDKRMLKDRIKKIKLQLKKVLQNRAQNRNVRNKNDIPIISLVGYTNAGKSTLFNVLTNSKTFTSNILFATLDSTLRKMKLPSGKQSIVVDTVGFISDLPHELIDAFKSTLEEILKSSLILHVIDINSNDKQIFIKQVNSVLEMIGADKIPQILVFNKVDKLSSKLDIDLMDEDKVWVSAKYKIGLDELQKKIDHKLFGDYLIKDISLTPEQGYIRHMLYEMGVVIKEETDVIGNSLLTVKTVKSDYLKICSKINNT